MMQGTLIRVLSSFYYVVAQGQEYTLRCKKKFRYQRMSPLVGDEVLFTPGEGEEHGWLEEILPRKTVCLRPPVSNVSLLLIVIAPTPAPDLLLVDRIIVRARQQGMKIALVASKSELDPSLIKTLQAEYAQADVSVVAVSSRMRDGLDDLRQLMQGHLCCLTGQSGVGKSTLLNTLLDLHLETGDISRKIQRGKNTTRHSEMILKDGLRVLDTAGFSLMELDGTQDPVHLKDQYPDFQAYEEHCRFSPCYHDKEPGCAVTAACQQGEINAERLNRYRLLLQEVRQMWRERYD